MRNESLIMRRNEMARASAAVVLVLACGASGALGQSRTGMTLIRGTAPTPAAPPPPVEVVDDGANQPADGAPPAATPPGAAAPGGASSPLSKEEIDSLKAQYESLPKERQDEMKAYYKDLGINLDQVLGLASAASAEAARVQEILGAMRDLDFARTPQNVLAARAKIGFGQVPQPNPATARGADMARWIHLQVMAGEWGVYTDYLRGRPKDEAQRVYTQVLQSLNKGNAGLLPEEVLALAEACPDEPKEWQSKAWAGMLKTAADKNSPGPMLAQIKQGTKFFGSGDAAKRRRTVELLAGAGLLAQAYEYLPPIHEARAAGDAELVLVHAMYKLELAAKEGSGPEGDGIRAEAWDLFCECSLMEKAALQTKRDAIKQAVGLMSRMPPSKSSAWLRTVFANNALGPAALEAIALSAAAVGDSKQQDDEQRAQAILSLKEAVDILLERKGLDQSVLRVPMRMLTTALITEMENAVEKKGRQRNVAKEAQLLLRAIPSKAWLDALEPSLAGRAGKACVGLATAADETDQALVLLADAIKRTPDQAVPIASHFLKTWEGRLSPRNDVDEDTAIYYFWREYVAQAPLTRGRQRRNLERLEQLMKTLETAGLDPRTLPGIASAFKACHGITEVYDRADIERVFGPLDKIPDATSAGLAQTMAASLNGDWRNRAAQVKQGVKRTDTEIAQLVDKGYGIAIELIDAAIAKRPDFWRYAVVKAGLSFDRMQFRRAQKKTGDAAKEAEYRVAAFAAFEEAAQRYASAVAAGTERESADVYGRWFGAAMGTSQLNFLNADDIPADGTPQNDQVERIRLAINALPPDAAFRHISDFARAIGAAVSRSDPEVKPKLVKQALRIIGDHPAGASLRSLSELYRDLVKDEIRLRMAIDGEDTVGTNRQFGMLVSLRFTNSVDRETGGFSKYLQTNAFVRVGRQYQEVNFRDKLQKNIETTLGKGFNVESVGFFDPFMPPRGVVEGGQDGWLEKPMAYVLVSRTDPAVDRVPQLTMDMQFEDQTGPVTLVLPSNTPSLAVSAAGTAPSGLRPCPELKITQVVDPRDARDGEKDRTIKLEVICRGKGAMPELKDVLTGIDTAVDGYKIEEKGIEAKPTVVMQDGAASSSRFYWGPPKPPEGGYPEPDENGMYRLAVERNWVVTYTPTSGSLGTEFRMPTLKEGVKATLESRYFSDLDLVPVQNGVVSVVRRSLLWPVLLGAGVCVLLVGGGVAYRRSRGRVHSEEAGIPLPAHATPLSTVMTLRRIQAEHGAALGESGKRDLDRDIEMIELKYFGPEAETNVNGELGDVLRRWAATVKG
jgi:hypothetical protein